MSSEPENTEAKAEEPPPKKKAAWRLKLEALIAEYGTAALLTWFGIFGLTWLGFVIVITLGFEVKSGGEGTGVVAIAYLATQAAKPLRLAATIALTPVVVKVWHRFFPPKAKDEEEEDDEDDEDDDEEAGEAAPAKSDGER
jgi:hypothetical protein